MRLHRSTHTLSHNHTYTNTQHICNFKGWIEDLEPRNTVQGRAHQLAAGSSSTSPIVIASHFNIAQTCAANAPLTHQRATENPHSSSEPHNYVTAVFGVGQTSAGLGQAWLKTLADTLKNGFSISYFDKLKLSDWPVGSAWWFPHPAWHA